MYSPKRDGSQIKKIFKKGQQKHYILTNVSSAEEKIKLMADHGRRQNYDLPSRLVVVGLDLPRGISTCLR